MKVAIVGPESTGKTVLAGELAERFGAPWVPEYAREYVGRLRRKYTEADVEAIARKQIEQELAYDHLPESEYVFFDTDLVITKVWFEHCYRRVPAFVTDRLRSRYFDLYLLCAPDLPWESDPLREHGDDRDYFFAWYLREIEALGTPCVIIEGQGSARRESAVAAVEARARNYSKG